MTTDPWSLPLTTIPPDGSLWVVGPLPPSVNHHKKMITVRSPKTGKVFTRPHLTRQAQAWIDGVGWSLKRRYPGDLHTHAPTPPLAVEVRVLVRSRGRQDIDNGGKLILDALLPPLGINDSWVDDLHFRRVLLPARTGGPVRCEIVVWSIDGCCVLGKADPG